MRRHPQGSISDEGCVRPNGSRLSCGALRKDSLLIYARHQLQALVRWRVSLSRKKSAQFWPMAPNAG